MKAHRNLSRKKRKSMKNGLAGMTRSRKKKLGRLLAQTMVNQLDIWGSSREQLRNAIVVTPLVGESNGS